MRNSPDGDLEAGRRVPQQYATAGVDSPVVKAFLSRVPVLATLLAIVLGLGAVLLLTLTSRWVPDRVAALTSVFGVLTSLVISVMALTIAREQAVSGREQVVYASEQVHYAALATLQAYQPILLPLHEAVAVERKEQGEPYHPSREPFTVPTPSISKRVFLVNRNARDAQLIVRNVGRGPAMIVSAMLADNCGRTATLDGNPAIGPDSEEQYIGHLDDSTQHAAPAPGTHLAAVWNSLSKQKANNNRVFYLRICYRGVGPLTTVQTLEAVFDPRGTGRWRMESPAPGSERPQRRSSEARASVTSRSRR